MEEQKHGADDLEFMNFDVTVVQLLSCVQLFVTPWTAATPGFPVLQCLLERAQIHVRGVSDAI